MSTAATSRTKRRRSVEPSLKPLSESTRCNKSEPRAQTPPRSRARADLQQSKKADSVVGLDASNQNGWADKVIAHRRRQISVADILDRTFGTLAKCSPDLWEQRAYLMLVGLVYERLAVHEDDITTDDLVTLAKVLAESRRAAARTRESKPISDAAQADQPADGQLPDRFADAVRQIYGLNTVSSSSTATR